jgi:hypothetical protein
MGYQRILIMTTRRILIFAPIFLMILLLQSYFWVPTYEQQTRGNPERFNEYITASIGDASILNPILSADASSSEIESKVFEGLIDYDENLRFRGRLATSWNVFEEAYFYVNESVAIPGLGHLCALHIIDFLQAEKQKKTLPSLELKATLGNITEISAIPRRDYTTDKQLKDSDANKKTIKIDIAAPARIKLVLKQVDQDLFSNLSQLLGKMYFENFESLKYIKTDSRIERDQLVAVAAELLPAVEHNPIIEFNLRSDVKFHDGHGQRPAHADIIEGLSSHVVADVTESKGGVGNALIAWIVLKALNLMGGDSMGRTAATVDIQSAGVEFHFLG